MLTYREVAAALGVSVSKVHALVAQGSFPRPITIGARSSRFDATEIDAWVAARKAERSKE